MSRDVGELGTIGVLMGGTSSERDISFKSGEAVLQALLEEGCRASCIEINNEDEATILKQLEDIDLAFIALHGRFGEDGELQGILDRANICYTGSGAQASQLAFDKIDCQKLFQSRNIVIPGFKVLIKNDPAIQSKIDLISPPVFVKPACEGSSIGISYVANKDDLKDALTLAWQYGNELLVEEAIAGREITVGILGHEALPIVEIRPKNSYFDFESKYKKGKTDYVVPAPLSKDLTQSIQETATETFRLLGCRHFGRVDFMLDQKDRYYLLELNTIPGFTATSLLPMAARCAGLNFNQLCLKLVEYAYGEKKKVSNITHSC